MKSAGTGRGVCRLWKEKQVPKIIPHPFPVLVYLFTAGNDLNRREDPVGFCMMVMMMMPIGEQQNGVAATH